VAKINPKTWRVLVASVFRFSRSINRDTRLVSIQFENQVIEAREGETIAAALLANGIDFTRKTPVNGQARAPFCMMGTCFECLMEVDQIPNRQACMIEVQQGMVVGRMYGPRNPDDGK
jgi:predicted molibdopterin-dependent oxidoreductase YjgC